MSRESRPGSAPIQRTLNPLKPFCINRKKTRKKILQLGEIVLWIELRSFFFFFVSFGLFCFIFLGENNILRCSMSAWTNKTGWINWEVQEGTRKGRFAIMSVFFYVLNTVTLFKSFCLMTEDKKTTQTCVKQTAAHIYIFWMIYFTDRDGWAVTRNAVCVCVCVCVCVWVCVSRARRVMDVTRMCRCLDYFIFSPSGVITFGVRFLYFVFFNNKIRKTKQRNAYGRET